MFYATSIPNRLKILSDHIRQLNKDVAWREPVAYMQYHPFVQQALLFGRHNEVVCVIFVVDDVLQINACNEKMRVRFHGVLNFREPARLDLGFTESVENTRQESCLGADLQFLYSAWK